MGLSRNERYEGEGEGRQAMADVPPGLTAAMMCEAIGPPPSRPAGCPRRPGITGAVEHRMLARLRALDTRLRMVAETLAERDPDITTRGPEGMTFREVCDIVRAERLYQKRRWGVRRTPLALGLDVFTENDQSVGDFIAFMDHYLTLARAGLATTSGPQTALENLRKVVALGVACFEQHGCPQRPDDRPVVNGHDDMEA